MDINMELEKEIFMGGYDELERHLLQVKSLAGVLLLIEPGANIEMANGIFWALQDSADNGAKLLGLIKDQTQQLIEVIDS